MSSNTFACPCCGFPDLDEPARSRHGNPSWDICLSCGFQFGVTDDDAGETYESWRAKWVSRGMPWDAEGIEPPPAGWDPRAQLASLDPPD